MKLEAQRFVIVAGKLILKQALPAFAPALATSMGEN